MNENVVLEKAACEVAKQSSIPPLIFQLPVNQGRKIWGNAQNSYVYKYPANIKIAYIKLMHVEQQWIFLPNGLTEKIMCIYIYHQSKNRT